MAAPTADIAELEEQLAARLERRAALAAVIAETQQRYNEEVRLAEELREWEARELTKEPAAAAHTAEVLESAPSSVSEDLSVIRSELQTLIASVRARRARALHPAAAPGEAPKAQTPAAILHAVRVKAQAPTRRMRCGQAPISAGATGALVPSVPRVGG